MWLRKGQGLPFHGDSPGAKHGASREVGWGTAQAKVGVHKGQPEKRNLAASRGMVYCVE